MNVFALKCHVRRADVQFKVGSVRDEGLVAAAAWETHDGKLVFKGGTARTNSHRQYPSGWCSNRDYYASLLKSSML